MPIGPGQPSHIAHPYPDRQRRYRLPVGSARSGPTGTGSPADAAESLRDGIAAAIEIRRQLLRDTADLRSLYKLTGLLAKVMLRFEQIECPSDDQALRSFVARFPDRVATDLLASARTDLGVARRMAWAVLAAWLETVVPIGLRA